MASWLLHLALHAGSLVLAWILPRWQARDDQRRIREDGSHDSLRGVFHRQRLTLRLSLLTAAALLAWLPTALAGQPDSAASGGATYLLAALALFGHQFNTRLNVARGLPVWRVSTSAHGARFDRLITRLSAWLRLNFGWRATADQLLERGAWVALVLTIPLYLFHLSSLLFFR